MIDLTKWLNEFVEKLEGIFGHRIYFIGLQGSYARKEQTEKSDIDIVVILNELYINDLKIYRAMLDTMSNRELICGFMSGKTELLNWETSDLFQFYYDTIPIKGTLDGLLEKIDKQAVKRAIKLGACNIYHSCVHNFVHEKSEDILYALYKSAVFVIQAIHFYETGKYIKQLVQLRKMHPQEKIINIAYDLKNKEKIDFENMSNFLFYWAKTTIIAYS